MFNPPSDGWTDMERMFIRTMLIKMYEFIDDPLDKFILLASMESGYKQDDISQMCGITQAAINKRLKKTKEVLRINFNQVTINSK